nr:hypothetical protein [Ensifer adhaerens]
MKFSGNTAYGPMAKNVAKATADSYKDGGGSSPQVIADVVSKAVKASKPKTRYAAGKFANMMINTRKWLGDRVFDRMVL